MLTPRNLLIALLYGAVLGVLVFSFDAALGSGAGWIPIILGCVGMYFLVRWMARRSGEHRYRPEPGCRDPK